VTFSLKQLEKLGVAPRYLALRRARLKSGMRISRVAQIVGISVGHIERLERFGGGASEQVLQRLERLYQAWEIVLAAERLAISTLDTPSAAAESQLTLFTNSSTNGQDNGDEETTTTQAQHDDDTKKASAQNPESRPSARRARTA